jgi:hypothetical protein
MNGVYENISIIFYRGGYEETIYDEKSHLLKLTSPDDWDGTFTKTVDAFRWVKENFPDYDYIIRTNTSTYLNTRAINFLLENNGFNEGMAYGPGLVINNISLGIPYLNGYFLVFHKKIVDVICENIIGVKNIVDDAGIGLLLYNKYGKKYLEECIGEVSFINSIDEPYKDIFYKSLGVRIKDEKNPENNFIKMVGFHIFNDNNHAVEPILPHKFTRILTHYGVIPIEKAG